MGNSNIALVDVDDTLIIGNDEHDNPIINQALLNALSQQPNISVYLFTDMTFKTTTLYERAVLIDQLKNYGVEVAGVVTPMDLVWKLSADQISDIEQKFSELVKNVRSDNRNGLRGLTNEQMNEIKKSLKNECQDKLDILQKNNSKSPGQAFKQVYEKLNLNAYANMNKNEFLEKHYSEINDLNTYYETSNKSKYIFDLYGQSQGFQKSKDTMLSFFSLTDAWEYFLVFDDKPQELQAVNQAFDDKLNTKLKHHQKKKLGSFQVEAQKDEPFYYQDFLKNVHYYGSLSQSFYYKRLSTKYHVDQAVNRYFQKADSSYSANDNRLALKLKEQLRPEISDQAIIQKVFQSIISSNPDRENSLGNCLLQDNQERQINLIDNFLNRFRNNRYNEYSFFLKDTFGQNKQNKIQAATQLRELLIGKRQTVEPQLESYQGELNKIVQYLKNNNERVQKALTHQDSAYTLNQQ